MEAARCGSKNFLIPRKVGNKAGNKVSSCPARRAGLGGLVHGQLGCCTNWPTARYQPSVWGQKSRGGKEPPAPVLSPFCLQTETPWAPCRPCLWACHPATTTPPRTATSPDTTTCPPCGIPRYPHFGARTVEGPDGVQRPAHLFLLPKAGDSAGCALPGEGENRRPRTWTRLTDEENGDMGARLPVPCWDTGWQEACIPFPQPIAPQGPQGLCTYPGGWGVAG